ncbi:hypothetical protein [Pseudoalteromonas sp. JC3]|uniref:hypothetical protein n=1 Tax=Pseudoalteromonas sp. JC3 TaxID=2810196 RepID=UPI0019D159F6|nr:hypothetical protein [Pseudoalteromonas sp. JC3]MBR8841684.1 hypothetical protein [Pseudoalteromonas sp. JC3]WJE07708.1 hypothetical protein QSH61_12485 [Pseudoalteromonas sp. JC3]
MNDIKARIENFKATFKNNNKPVKYEYPKPVSYELPKGEKYSFEIPCVKYTKPLAIKYG